MSSVIKIKRSSIAGKLPNTTNILTGELALNLKDGRLFSSNGTSVFEIGANVASLRVGSGPFSIGNGAIIFPSTDGLADQVLKTDGNGNLSFATVSGTSGTDIYLEVANASAIYSTKAYAASNTYVNQTFETKATALSSNNALKNLINDRLQIANAAAIYSTKAYAASNTYVNQTFETKATALSSNNALKNLINDRLQVANAAAIYSTQTYVNQTFETKATALSSNNALKNLINNRLQVANAAAIYATKAYAASNTYVNQTFETKSTALSSNNALKNLINDRMQVANVSLAISTAISNLVDSAPATLDTLNELAAALGDDANFSSTILTLVGTKAANTYVNQTFETKSTALSSNNALKNLINNRLQVANASAIYATKAYASSNTYVNQTFETKATALSSNNALKNLINNRLQVANASAIYATKAYAASNTYVNQTFETKATALSSNNALKNLINDRLQVSNAAALFLRSDVADTAAGTITFSAGLDISAGDINFLPDTGDVIQFDGGAFLKRLTVNGGARIGKDDILIIGSGEMAASMESNYTSHTDEIILLGSEGGIRFYSSPNNLASWATVNVMIFDTSGNLTVPGQLNATTKSFVIDHPSKPGMKLRYGSLEGPEHGVYVRGILTDSDTIELPDHWIDLIDENSITVQLTAIGFKSNLWVKDIKENKIKIDSDNKINCFYFIQATRKDVDKLITEFEEQ